MPDLMFMANWLFSLVLFFFMGFSLHASMAQKSKRIMMHEVKQIALNIFKGIKNDRYADTFESNHIWRNADSADKRE